MFLKLLITIVVSSNFVSLRETVKNLKDSPDLANIKKNQITSGGNYPEMRAENEKAFFQKALNDLNRNNDRKMNRIRNRRKNHDIAEISTITSTNLTQFYNNNMRKKQNRCQSKNGGCSQKCFPKSKHKCGCFNGYRLAANRKHCIDIDECRHANGNCSHYCVNLPGFYQCKCPIGLRLRNDRKTCEDINECLLRNGHGPCDDICVNTYSSYICDCKRKGTRLNPNKHTCDDINECRLDNGGCSHLCKNAYGRYYCTCPIGMVLKSDWRTCQDINECQDGLVKDCDKTHCINTIGSYYCDNNMVRDQGSMNMVCPPLYPPKHGYFQCLRNVHLRNFTKTGRPLIVNYPGLKCYLICPIGYKLHGNNEFTCNQYGRWINTKKGICLKMSKPLLKCPPDQIVYRKFGEKEILVRFPPPVSDVRWELLKSHPTWAKNLKKSLKPGIYFVSFTINHPTFLINFATKCSFTIRVI